MLLFHKARAKRRANEDVKAIQRYLQNEYTAPKQYPQLYGQKKETPVKQSPEMRFSMKNPNPDNDVRYCLDLGDDFWEKTREIVNRTPEDPDEPKDYTEIIKMYRSGSVRWAEYMHRKLGATFAEKLQSIMLERGLTAPQVYKAAHVDRKLYSRIMNDRHTGVSKDTALAFIFALHLSIDEAEDMLERAGYVLSHSNSRDIILEYLLTHQVYDIVEINMVLEALNEKILGRETR